MESQELRQKFEKELARLIERKENVESMLQSLYGDSMMHDELNNGDNYLDSTWKDSERYDKEHKEIEARIERLHELLGRSPCKTGTLIILSGPSCVGKGPLVSTLEIYFKSINKSLKRHVLYNSRNKKIGEEHGVTYWYTYLWNVKRQRWNKTHKWYNKNFDITYNPVEAERNIEDIQKLATKEKQDFKKFEVSGDWQGLNKTVLKNELDTNDVVLLEIAPKEVDDVIAFCDIHYFEVKRVFISPLTDDDFINAECYTVAQRAIYTENTMLKKLIRRGRDSVEDILKRAYRARKEVEDARTLRKNNANDFIYFENHFGEDMKSEWENLKKRVKDAKYIDKNNNIDNTFRNFIKQVFPEIIPIHLCKDNLNGCTCKICGKRQHVIKVTEGNYGSGCGTVERTCIRCGAYDRFNDATGCTYAQSDNW